MNVSAAARAALEGDSAGSRRCRNRSRFSSAGWNLWRWLVILGIVALWLEWWLYYSSRENQRAAEIRETPGDGELQNDGSESEQNHEQSEARNPNFGYLGG